jgi:hypothetical protein
MIGEQIMRKTIMNVRGVTMLRVVAIAYVLFQAGVLLADAIQSGDITLTLTPTQDATTSAPTLSSPGHPIKATTQPTKIATGDINCSDPGMSNSESQATILYSYGLSLEYKGLVSGTWGAAPSGSSVYANPSGSNHNGNASIYGIFPIPGYYHITVTGGASFTDGTRHGHSGASNPKHLYVLAVQIDITSGGSVVTDQTVNAVVGSQMNLGATIAPNDLTPTSYSWSIPGSKVANYVVTYSSETAATSATVTQFTSGSTQNVTYYWVDGQDGRNVSVTLEAAGKSFVPKATFNVKAPTTAGLAADNYDTSHVDYFRAGSIASWYIGHVRAPNTTITNYPYLVRVGIWAHHDCTVPAPYATTGSFSWVQVITVATSTCTHEGWTGDWYEHMEPTSGLDTSFPYSSGSDFSDSPQTPYDRGSYDYKYHDFDAFEYWLLYNPGGSNSIYVPVAKGDWGCGGDGTRSNTSNPDGWHAVSGTLGQYCNSFSATTEFPEWTQNGGNEVLGWVPG